MLIKAPADLYRTPVVKQRRDKQTRQPIPGETYMVQTVTIEGDSVDFFVDEDLTLQLNGQREQLDKGAAVPVVAHIELVGYRGSPRVNLVGFEPRK